MQHHSGEPFFVPPPSQELDRFNAQLNELLQGEGIMLNDPTVSRFREAALNIIFHQPRVNLRVGDEVRSILATLLTTDNGELVNRLTSIFEKLQQQLSQLEIQLASTTRKMTILEMSDDISKRRRYEMEARLSHLWNDRIVQDWNIKGLQTENQHLGDHIKGLQAENKGLQMENKRLGDHIKGLETDIKGLQAENKGLQVENKRKLELGQLAFEYERLIISAVQLPEGVYTPNTLAELENILLEDWEDYGHSDQEKQELLTAQTEAKNALRTAKQSFLFFDRQVGKKIRKALSTLKQLRIHAAHPCLDLSDGAVFDRLLLAIKEVFSEQQSEMEAINYLAHYVRAQKVLVSA